MSPIAASLSQTEMEDVAAYYAAQSGPDPRPPGDVDPLALRTGAAIAAAGLSETGVPACVNCHGAEGRGLPPSYPWLAGQYAPYTELQLRLFKSGERSNDPLSVMRQVASGLSEEEMRALALYFDSLSVVEPAATTAAAQP
jgi:cytochrome c553